MPASIANQQQAEKLSAKVRKLRARCTSVAKIALACGISRQRVYQIIKAKT